MSCIPASVQMPGLLEISLQGSFLVGSEIIELALILLQYWPVGYRVMGDVSELVLRSDLDFSMATVLNFNLSNPTIYANLTRHFGCNQKHIDFEERPRKTRGH